MKRFGDMTSDGYIIDDDYRVFEVTAVPGGTWTTSGEQAVLELVARLAQRPAVKKIYVKEIIMYVDAEKYRDAGCPTISSAFLER